MDSSHFIRHWQKTFPFESFAICFMGILSFFGNENTRADCGGKVDLIADIAYKTLMVSNIYFIDLCWCFHGWKRKLSFKKRKKIIKVGNKFQKCFSFSLNHPKHIKFMRNSDCFHFLRHPSAASNVSCLFSVYVIWTPWCVSHFLDILEY